MTATVIASLVLLLSAACGGSDSQRSRARPRPAPPIPRHSDPSTHAAPAPEPPPAAPTCGPLANTLPDSLIVEREVIPPPAVQPRRRRGQPRVIVLTEMDAANPRRLERLFTDGRVERISPDVEALDAADARALPGGAFRYIATRWITPPVIETVIVSADGTTRTTPGGAGRPGALGGYLQDAEGPVSDDGRIQTTVEWPEDDFGGRRSPPPALVVRDVVGDRELLRRPLFISREVARPGWYVRGRARIALDPDARRVAVCFPSAAAPTVWRIDLTAPDRITEQALPARCRAISVHPNTVAYGDDDVTLDWSGTTHALGVINSPIAFDPCNRFVAYSRARSAPARSDLILRTPDGTERILATHPEPNPLAHDFGIDQITITRDGLVLAFSAGIDVPDLVPFAIVAAISTPTQTRTFPIPRETTALTHVPSP